MSALVILFFVISMTDDLHNQQVLVEDRKSVGIAAAMAMAYVCRTTEVVVLSLKGGGLL
jgi:hypothetical protein